MEERVIDVRTDSGSMPTFVTHPSEKRAFPTVVLYMDVWGVREELFDIARRIATVGYYCMVPDLYYRQGKVRHEFRNEKNQMITLDRLDQQKKAAVLAPLKKLSDAMVIDDTGALLRFVDAGEPVRPRALGSVGYCMGGRHVFRVGAAFPERFRASACLHGTDLVNGTDNSPHRDIAKAEGELYCGFAEKDRHTPPELVAGLDRASSQWKVRYRREVHAGADHGYALPDRDIYDKRAANRDWELIFAMYQRQMPAYGA